jgi:hypothetical protein
MSIKVAAPLLLPIFKRLGEGGLYRNLRTLVSVNDYEKGIFYIQGKEFNIERVGEIERFSKGECGRKISS